MSARGLEFRTVVTSSLEHGVDEAIAAHEAGERPGGDERRRAGRPDRRGARRERARRWASSPAGAATTSRGCSASRTSPADAVALLADGQRARDRRRRGEREALPRASPRWASTPRRTGSRTRRRLIKGNLVYAYAALRALAAWKPATFTVTCDDGEPFEVRLRGRRRQQQGVRRRDVHRARRRARRRRARRRHDRRSVSKLRFLAQPAQGLQGHPRRARTRSTCMRAADGRGRAPTAPSPSTPTASTSRTCRPSCACCAARCA